MQKASTNLPSPMIPSKDLGVNSSIELSTANKSKKDPEYRYDRFEHVDKKKGSYMAIITPKCIHSFKQLDLPFQPSQCRVYLQQFLAGVILYGHVARYVV